MIQDDIDQIPAYGKTRSRGSMQSWKHAVVEACSRGNTHSWKSDTADEISTEVEFERVPDAAVTDRNDQPDC